MWRRTCRVRTDCSDVNDRPSVNAWSRHRGHVDSADLVAAQAIKRIVRNINYPVLPKLLPRNVSEAQTERPRAPWAPAERPILRARPHAVNRYVQSGHCGVAALGGLASTIRVTLALPHAGCRIPKLRRVEIANRRSPVPSRTGASGPDASHPRVPRRYCWIVATHRHLTSRPSRPIARRRAAYSVGDKVKR
jgi:hypothetical protein